MNTAVFLDTMIYSHYKPIDQIDWRGVLKVDHSTEVVIVVPGVTLGEIDKHKNHTPLAAQSAGEPGGEALPAANLRSLMVFGMSGTGPSPCCNQGGSGPWDGHSSRAPRSRW